MAKLPYYPEQTGQWPQPLLSVDEVSRFLGIAPEDVQTFIRNGRLAARKFVTNDEWLHLSDLRSLYEELASGAE